MRNVFLAFMLLSSIVRNPPITDHATSTTIVESATDDAAMI